MSSLAGVALGGGIAMGSGLLGVGAQALLRRGERAADVRERRRQEAAGVVGPSLAALRDLEPNSNVGALAGNPRAAEAMSQKWTAWLAVSGGLELLGATHPDTDVADLCESVILKGGSLLNRLHLTIILDPGEPRSEAWWDEVNGFHEQAIADARRLVRAVLAQPA